MGVGPVTRMVAAQSAPVPPRRKRGGRPARCSAMVFLWLFALVVSSHAATDPAPDPVPHTQPDAAPGSSSQPSKPPAQQPVTRPTTTVKPPAITQPLATT